jgi:hypothetical protein
MAKAVAFLLLDSGYLILDSRLLGFWSLDSELWRPG